MPADWPWDALGLDGKPEEPKALKRAYARTLKTIDQEAEPGRFQTLREAFEAAERMLKADAAPPPRPKPAPRPDPFPAPEMQAAAPVQAAEPDPVAPHPEPRVDPFPDAVVSVAEPASVSDGPDWEQMDILIQRITNTALPIKSRLHVVGQDPAMADPMIHDEVERAFLDHLMEVSTEDGHGGLILPEAVGRSTVEAIDALFGWLSDYTTMRRKFPYADDLVIALGQRYSPPSADLDRHIAKTQREAELQWILAAYGIGAIVALQLALRLTGSIWIAIPLAIIAGRLAVFGVKVFRRLD